MSWFGLLTRRALSGMGVLVWLVRGMKMVNLEQSIYNFSKLHDCGVITSAELVCQFVHDVIVKDRQRDAVSLLALLPHEVAEDVLAFIRAKREDGYRWDPRPVGPGFTDADLARISSGLREMDRTLLVSGSIGKSWASCRHGGAEGA